MRYFRKIGFLILNGSFLISVNLVMAMQEPRDLYDFTHQETSGLWMIVNDGVMGGISESRLSLNQQGFLVFEGRSLHKKFTPYIVKRAKELSYSSSFCSF